MIRKLKTRFIALTMASLLALLAVIVTAMNVVNYNSVLRESDTILSILCENKGEFPHREEDRPGALPPDMSPETPFESRYFSAVVADGTVRSTDTGKIASVSASAAEEYALRAYASGRTRGFLGQFRYLRTEEDGTSRIVFLDCGRKLDSFYGFLRTSVIMSLAGLAAVGVMVFVLAGRIIRPIAESYAKQRQFITDAGHEMKTPLTIIAANADLLEMDLGENESLGDIIRQTRRLRTLTEDLTLLSRMEEAEDTLQKVDFPLSDTVSEAAAPFRTLARQQEKLFTLSIQPLLTLRGDAKAIRQLTELLLDNALKYSPPGGAIDLTLSRQGRTATLTVTNATGTDIDPDQLPRLFDRFYRADASRNSETGGHGIGLSVAKAIVTAHGGSIRAISDGPRTFRIRVSLPS